MTDEADLQQQVAVLTQRLDELESRAALRDLVSNYCYGFDGHDWDLFISIWHPDAVWDIGPPFGSFEGHEGIREAVYDVLYPAWRESHHLTTNFKIEFSDADHASGVSKVDCMGANPDDVVQMVGATYTDDFERRDGVWKIARRGVTIHYYDPMPGIGMTAPESA